VSTRAAEDAVAQASTLLDGIARLDADLLEAGARIATARAETEKDLAEARAMLASGNSRRRAAQDGPGEHARQTLGADRQT
jgi:hypothetical protein